MSSFRRDERVNIAIECARVADSFQSSQDGEVLVIVIDDSPSNEKSMTLNLAAPSITVERTIPERWPPVVGDAWGLVDSDPWGGPEHLWFAQNTPDGIRMVPTQIGDDGPLSPDELRERGELKLRFRNPWEPPF